MKRDGPVFDPRSRRGTDRFDDERSILGFLANLTSAAVFAILKVYRRRSNSASVQLVEGKERVTKVNEDVDIGVFDTPIKMGVIYGVRGEIPIMIRVLEPGERGEIELSPICRIVKNARDSVWREEGVGRRE